jgi:hypothetical protein
MTKDKTTRTERVQKAKRDFKRHVKESNRKKDKHVKKQEKIKLKANEEFKFRQHMARLLGSEM